jgi:hypothetical protein
MYKCSLLCEVIVKLVTRAVLQSDQTEAHHSRAADKCGGISVEENVVLLDYLTCHTENASFWTTSLALLVFYHRRCSTHHLALLH